MDVLMGTCLIVGLFPILFAALYFGFRVVWEMAHDDVVRQDVQNIMTDNRRFVNEVRQSFRRKPGDAPKRKNEDKIKNDDLIVGDDGELTTRAHVNRPAPPIPPPAEYRPVSKKNWK